MGTEWETPVSSGSTDDTRMPKDKYGYPVAQPVTPTPVPTFKQPETGGLISVMRPNSMAPAPAMPAVSASDKRRDDRQAQGQLPPRSQALPPVASAGAPPPIAQQNLASAGKAAETSQEKLASDIAKPAGTTRIWNDARNMQPTSTIGRIGKVGAEIGAGLLRGIDVAGGIAAPRIMGQIPGTDLNRRENIQQDQANVTKGLGDQVKAASTVKDMAEADKAEAGPEGTYREVSGGMTDPTHPEMGQQQAFFNEHVPSDIQYGGPMKVAGPQMTLSDPEVDRTNGANLERYQINHPDAAELPASFKLPYKASQEEVNRIDKLLGGTESAQGAATARAGQKSDADNRNKERGAKEQQDNYNKVSARFDKIADPITQQDNRISRLRDTLNKETPAADALVAPELLTAMAGGIGSGLRLNEAEIYRVVSGRSNWETLKATLNQWKTDPKNALSITAEQRKEMSDLIDAVESRANLKKAILNHARADLLAAPDIKTQNAIRAQAERDLNDNVVESRVDKRNGKDVHKLQSGKVVYDDGTEVK